MQLTASSFLKHFFLLFVFEPFWWLLAHVAGPCSVPHQFEKMLVLDEVVIVQPVLNRQGSIADFHLLGANSSNAILDLGQYFQISELASQAPP